MLKISVDALYIRVFFAFNSDSLSNVDFSVTFIDFPKLSNIVIEPNDADYGETVNLICDITDFSPKEICAQWFLGDKSITNGAVTENLDMASNGCYKLNSVLKLKATASVCDKAICFKASHARLTKPITRKVFLKLPGAY